MIPDSSPNDSQTYDTPDGNTLKVTPTGNQKVDLPQQAELINEVLDIVRVRWPKSIVRLTVKAIDGQANFYELNIAPNMLASFLLVRTTRSELIAELKKRAAQISDLSKKA